MKHLSFWLILFLWASNLHSQIRLRIPPSIGSIISPADLLQVSLSHQQGAGMQLLLIGSLSQDGEVIWEGESQALNLPAGEHHFSAGQLSWEQQQGRFPAEGQYLYCLKVVSFTTSQELAQICTSQRFSGNSPSSRHQKNTELPIPTLRGIQFSGQARLSGQHSNLPNPFSQLPASYGRIAVQPQLSIAGIPLQGQVFWSTEQKQLNYDLNSISLNLNHHQLIENLKQQALAKLEAELSGVGARDSSLFHRLMELREESYQEALAKLDPKTRHLMDSSHQHLFQVEEKLERMKQMLAHPQLAEAEAEWEDQLRVHQLTSPEQQQAFEDSLQLHAPEQYAKWVAGKGRFHQAQRLRKKVTELENQGKELGSFSSFRQQARELERIREASPEELLQDPNTLRKIGQFGKGYGFLTQISSFGVGNVLPNHSALSLQGVSLNGIQLAWQGEKWYSDVAIGKLRSGPWQSLDPTQAPSAWLAAVRAGWGAPTQSHVHLLSQASWEMGAQAAGRSQQLIGLSAQYLLWKERFRVQGQVMHSKWQNETPLIPASDSFPIWGLWGTAPLSSTGTAWSVETELKLFQGNTQLFGKWMEVPENYYSPAAPMLIRGQQAYEVRVRQQLMKSRIQLSAYGRKNRNDLLPLVPVAASAVSIGLDLALRLPKLPYLQLTYAPFYQEQIAQDTAAIRPSGYRQSLFNLVSGYHAQLGKISSTTNVIYSLQWGGTSKASDVFLAHLLSATQSFQFPSSFALTGSATFVQADYSLALNRTLQGEINASGSLFHRWTHTLGVMAQQQEKQAAHWGGYWQQQLALAPSLSLDLLLRYNPLTTITGFPINEAEQLAQLGISYQW
jgi:hypothetical protein